jgi:hypothetical protein
MNPNRQATPKARDTVSNLHTFANNVVQGQLPEYFYEGYCASRLFPVNKVHPHQLNPGDIQESRPINIGLPKQWGSERTTPNAQYAHHTICSKQKCLKTPPVVSLLVMYRTKVLMYRRMVLLAHLTKVRH